jgi:hypothetical protein
MFFLGSAGQTNVFAIDEFAQFWSYILFIFLQISTVKNIVCIWGVGGVAFKTFEFVQREEIVITSTVAEVLDVQDHHVFALFL